MKQDKKIKAYMLMDKSNGELVMEAGISDDKELIEPNNIYKKYYGVVKVEVFYRDMSLTNNTQEFYEETGQIKPKGKA